MRPVPFRFYSPFQILYIIYGDTRTDNVGIRPLEVREAQHFYKQWARILGHIHTNFLRCLCKAINDSLTYNTILLFIYAFIMMWFDAGLFVFHSYLLWTNQTTYEQVERMHRFKLQSTESFDQDYPILKISPDKHK